MLLFVVSGGFRKVSSEDFLSVDLDGIAVYDDQ